ncbi:MAG: isochorismatase family protein [Pseudomonadota bacterium]
MIKARPYAFPCTEPFAVETTLLCLLGFQRAAVDETGASGACALHHANRLAAAWAGAGGRCVLSRRGLPGGAVAPPAARFREGRRTVDCLARAGSAEWELALDVPGATVVDHPADNAFLASDLDHIVHLSNMRALIICGLRTEGIVHATMRAANDKGLDCLLVEDACASDDAAFHDTILSVTTFGNGLFGAVADTDAVLAAL